MECFDSKPRMPHAGGRVSYLLALVGKCVPETHQCFSDRARRDKVDKGIGKGKGQTSTGKTCCGTCQSAGLSVGGPCRSLSVWPRLYDLFFVALFIPYAQWIFVLSTGFVGFFLFLALPVRPFSLLRPWRVVV